MLSLLRSPRAWIVAAFAVLALLLLCELIGSPSAMLEVCRNHARGHFEVKTYGYPARWSSEYRRLLRQRYGVKLTSVAGCCITDELESYVECYNAVSRRLLTWRYGRDIFAECSALAERRWRATNPGQ